MLAYRYVVYMYCAWCKHVAERACVAEHACVAGLLFTVKDEYTHTTHSVQLQLTTLTLSRCWKRGFNLGVHGGLPWTNTEQRRDTNVLQQLRQPQWMCMAYRANWTSTLLMRNMDILQRERITMHLNKLVVSKNIVGCCSNVKTCCQVYSSVCRTLQNCTQVLPTPIIVITLTQMT